MRLLTAVCLTLTLAACERRTPDSETHARGPEGDTLQPTRSWLLPGVVDVVDAVLSRDAADSTLWIFTTDSMPLVRVDVRSGAVSRRGRRGRGPTDVLFPWNFADAGTVETPPRLFDVGGMKLMDLLPNATVRHRSVMPTLTRTSITSDFRQIFTGHPKKLLQLGERWIWLEPGPSAHSDRHLWPIRVLAASPSEVRVDTVLWRDVIPELAAHPAYQALIPVPLMARCSNALAVVYLGEPDSLLWFDATGRIRHAASSGLRRQPMTAAVRRNYMAPRIAIERRQAGGAVPDVGELARLLSSMDERFRTLAPDSTPRATALACDADGGVALSAVPWVADGPQRAAALQVTLVSTSGRRSHLALPSEDRVVLKTPEGVWTFSDEAAAGASVHYYAVSGAP